MKKIWVVNETILGENGHRENNEEGFYSSKKKAVKAVYDYLRHDFSEKDIKKHVKQENYEKGVYIITKCGEKYGMFDCEYYILPCKLDSDLGT